MFQETIRQVTAGVPGALDISDDIIVHSDTREQYNRTLGAVLTHLQNHNLTLNKDKCAFHIARPACMHFFGEYLHKSRHVSRPAEGENRKRRHPTTKRE